MPRLADVAIGLWQRAAIFLKRAGTIILTTTVVLWALASFPVAGPGQKQSDVSIAGRIGDAIHVVVAPIGFLADHVEILYDLDIEARAMAEARGLVLHRTRSLDASPRLLEALEGVARPLLARFEAVSA